MNIYTIQISNYTIIQIIKYCNVWHVIQKSVCFHDRMKFCLTKFISVNISHFCKNRIQRCQLGIQMIYRCLKYINNCGAMYMLRCSIRDTNKTCQQEDNGQLTTFSFDWEKLEYENCIEDPSFSITMYRRRWAIFLNFPISFWNCIMLTHQKLHNIIITCNFVFYHLFSSISHYDTHDVVL